MSICKQHILEIENDKHKLCFYLMYAYGWIMNFYNTKLKKFGITTHQYLILKYLERYYPEPTSINDLRQCMPEKQSDVSRLIDRLVRNDLVIRNICPLDRRKMDVTINEKGLELVKSISNEEKNWIDEFIKIDIDEAKSINHLIIKLIWNE